MAHEATPVTGRPLRRDAQRNREAILAAAKQLFAERGVDTTLDDIAAHAGVGVGTVYRRYPNKNALLDELFEERIAELGRLAEAALEQRDAWTALTGFLERAEELFAADRALEHLVVHPDRARARTARAREQLQPAIESLIARAKRDGRLRADFEASDMRMIHTMLAAVITQAGDTSPDLWRRYFVMIVDGLASRRSSATEAGVPAPPA